MFKACRYCTGFWDIFWFFKLLIWLPMGWRSPLSVFVFNFFCITLIYFWKACRYEYRGYCDIQLISGVFWADRFVVVFRTISFETSRNLRSKPEDYLKRLFDGYLAWNSNGLSDECLLEIPYKHPGKSRGLIKFSATYGFFMVEVGSKLSCMLAHYLSLILEPRCMIQF